MFLPGNYFLTVLAPIDYLRGGSQEKLRRLEECLDKLRPSQPFESPEVRAKNVPLAALPMVHMARFLIIDEIPVQMGNERSGALASKYLLFIAELDGDRDTFLYSFFRDCWDVAVGVFEKCVGFPDNCTERQFARYIKQYEVRSTLPFAAYPGISQPRVQHVLSVRNELTNFIVNHQATRRSTCMRNGSRSSAGWVRYWT